MMGGFAEVVPFISLATHIGTGIAELLNYKHLRDQEQELKTKLGIPPAGQAVNPATGGA